MMMVIYIFVGNFKVHDILHENDGQISNGTLGATLVEAPTVSIRSWHMKLIVLINLMATGLSRGSLSWSKNPYYEGFIVCVCV